MNAAEGQYWGRMYSQYLYFGGILTNENTSHTKNP